MHVLPRAALVVVCAIWAAPIAAQERLTVDEAVRLALARNPAAAAAEAAVAAADSRSSEARAGYLPRVDFSEAWQRSNLPVFAFGSLLNQRRFTAEDFALDTLNHPDALTNFRSALSVEQPLYDSGRTVASTHVSMAQADAARADRDRVIADLRFATIRAYSRAIAARAQRATADAARTAASEDLARVTSRRDRGAETDAAVLEMQVLDDMSEAEQVRAREDDAVARAALNAVIGAPLDAAFTLDEARVDEASLPDETTAEQEAVRNRPDLRRAALAVTAAEAGLSGSKHSFLPTVVALGSVEGNGATFGDRTSAWAAGMQFRWNVFAGGADSAKVKTATETVRAARSDRDAAELSVRLDARAALGGARSALAREKATRSSVEHARESQRIIRNRYEAGIATSADLLRAADTVSRAEALRVGAIADAQVAVAALARAMGKDQP